MEAENKQLHQVIKQLRQVRKNNQGESDSLIAERDELRINNTSLQEEIAKLQTIIDNNTTNTELISKFKSDIQSYQNKLITIEQLLDTNNKIISNLEKDNYEKTSNMEILKSDYLLLQQEAEQKSLELRNLKDAINEFEKEKLVEIERIKLNHVNNMNQLRNELELVITSIKNENNEKLLLQQQRTNYLLEQIQEHELFRRKAEIDLINEKKTMQRSLENALSQLQNSQNDVIDRATVASLVVSYFQKKRY